MTISIMTKPPEVHTLWNAISYLQNSVGWPHYHHDRNIVDSIKLLREALAKVEGY